MADAATKADDDKLASEPVSSTDTDIKDVTYNEHNLSLEEIEAKWKIKIKDGLTSEQVLENRARYGENRITPPPRTPEWVKYLLQYSNFFALLLLGAGLLCFIGYAIDPDKDQTNLYLGVVLFLVVFCTATFSYRMEAKSEQIMESFKSMIPEKAKVLRNGGQIVELDVWELVPGDICVIDDGDQVPADLRIVESNELSVDNSSLTGESEPQTRNAGPTEHPVSINATNLAFYTTMVQTGTAKGVVCGTANNTQMGVIAVQVASQDSGLSPIRVEISHFIHLISAVAIVLGISFFIIGFLIGTDPIKNVVFAIGIIVANVPEGLLATVTVSLALTAQRMYSKNVLVKNLEAVETLGSTTVIASDKTGTLTQNRMTVQHCWFDNTIFSTPAARNAPELQQMLQLEPGVYSRESPSFKKLQMIATLNNNAKFLIKDASLDVAERTADDTFNVLSLATAGDASESGLMKFTQCLEDNETYRERYPKIFEIKFNSTNKWQLSIHQDGTNHPVLVIKGAAERIVKMCRFICVNGKEVPMTDEHRRDFESAYAELGGMGERVLGFAYKKFSKKYDNSFKFEQKPEINFPMDDLVFTGLISLIDPARPGVPQAVQKCKNANIKVFMVTGDHPITARAIAKQVGIIDQDKYDAGKAAVFTGDDIRSWDSLSDAEQKAKWDFVLSHEQLVFARVSPVHKLMIVQNAKERGEIVAVTGDGVNDAPALKKGSIGIAMGLAGKDVTIKAAAMVLMDDNFASIVNGVEEGRLIFDNLKKSIAYTLTSNIPEIGPFLCYIVLSIPLPLSTVLILCVDLGTDMVPAISLAFELKESDIMNRPPRNAATDRLVNARLVSFAYLQIGIMQALAGFYTYMVVLNDYGYAPRILTGLGYEWEDHPLLCTVDGTGRPNECGYGCKGAYIPEVGKSYCAEGCSAQNFDPFVEITPSGGFRGIGEQNTCGRSCSWYNTNKFTGLAQGLWTADEQVRLDLLCKPYTDSLALNPFVTPAATLNFGFPGREQVSPAAPRGAFYWWGGTYQMHPNKEYQVAALEYAQTAYFISIIVVQWADLLIAKTRKLSIFEQGLSNSFMSFGLVFETLLGAILIYTYPLNTVFSTKPIHILHWFTGVPWSMLIFTYDETRKYLMRSGKKDNWFERFTYW